MRKLILSLATIPLALGGIVATAPPADAGTVCNLTTYGWNGASGGCVYGVTSVRVYCQDGSRYTHRDSWRGVGSLKKASCPILYRRTGMAIIH